ncbi:DUF2982 domain-containing protein [Veronia pacifica]|uniref:DUF2982 domain-containing protein n=1 Tax=Veronia pacifica TaxID=1080227 RepID=A0A1C3EE35_9GAMM|nr:DUF2982 domain-containing protein [Veronia pacifica]ODA31470.1 hypothetical protein A8L45_16940 [Veronia pacifica]
MSRPLLIFHNQGKASKNATIAVCIIGIALSAVLLANPSIAFATGLIVFMIVLSLSGYIVYLLNQPTLTFSFSEMHLQHHTPKGGWLLRWSDIREVGIPALAAGGWNHTLPWMGIRINDYDAFLDSISFRLASEIIMEQRGLLLSAYRHRDEKDMSAIEDMIFDDKPYHTLSGKEYKGLVAMLANRMAYNRSLLGYDVFVSEDVMDRPLQDFVGLTRRYLAAAAGLESIPEEDIVRLKQLASDRQHKD